MFGKLYYVAGQLGGSWTRDAIGTRAAPLWDAEFDRTGRAWGFNYHITGFGRDFEAQSGFVPRNDIVQAPAFNRLTWYGRPGWFIECFQTFFGPYPTWRYRHTHTPGPPPWAGTARQRPYGWPPALSVTDLGNTPAALTACPS